MHINRRVGTLENLTVWLVRYIDVLHHQASSAWHGTKVRVYGVEFRDEFCDHMPSLCA